MILLALELYCLAVICDDWSKCDKYILYGFLWDDYDIHGLVALLLIGDNPDCGDVVFVPIVIMILLLPL